MLPPQGRQNTEISVLRKRANEMKITKIDLMVLQTGSKRPRDNGCRPVVCRIYTDEDIYGDGEAAMLLMSGALASFGMLKDLSEMILGMNPLDHEVIWNKLYRQTYFAQNGGPIMYSAISALDMALWDIKGKYFGVPIYRLLGGRFRSEVDCYASQFQSGWGIDMEKSAVTPEDYARYAKEAVSQGYQVLKGDFLLTDRQGRTLTEEDRTGRLSAELLKLAEERVAAVRRAVGPDIQLIVENHGYLDTQTALRLARRIRPYDILYFEEPCTPFLPTAKFLAAEAGIPISGGERLFTRWQYVPYMEARAYQLLQPDLGNCGGITEVKKIIDLAAVYEIGVQLHCVATPLSQAAALNMEAAMPNFVFHEHASFQSRDFIRRLCEYDYQPQEGKLKVPELPGIGNTLSEYALKTCERYTVSK